MLLRAGDAGLSHSRRFRVGGSPAHRCRAQLYSRAEKLRPVKDVHRPAGSRGRELHVEARGEVLRFGQDDRRKARERRDSSRSLTAALITAALLWPCVSAAADPRLAYPPTRKSEQVDDYHG